MISIVVNNSASQIKDLNNLDIIDAISKQLTYTLDSAKYSFKYKMGGWNGETRLLTPKLMFPTGLLNVVTDVLVSFGITPHIVDKRDFTLGSDGPLKWEGHSLYPYQQEIVDIALDKKGGMIKAATGSGKTNMISKLVGEFNLPTVIYVVSLDLLTQMKATLEFSLGQEIGIIGNGSCVIKKINVCSAWTAGKVYSTTRKHADEIEEDVGTDKWNPNENQRQAIRDMVENARLVILDEAQFAAATSIRAILKNSKSASFRYGFSGTPWRTGGDDILLSAAFGPNICDLKASTLIQQGYLVPAKIAFRDIPPYHVPLPKNWKAVKSRYIVTNNVRNQILISNTIKLLEMGRRPLILFRELAHGKILESMLPSDLKYVVVTGNLDQTQRDDIRDRFKSGQIDLILASSVYDQGVDLPALDALVLAGGGKSTSKALQRIGRVIRANKSGGKKDAIIVETFDQANYVKLHSYKRYEIYRTEPEFKIKLGQDMCDYISRYHGN